MFEDFQVARFRHDRQQPPVFGDVARVGVAPLFVGPHALRAPPAGSREGFPFFVFQIGSTTGCVEIVKEIKTNERQKIGQNLATPQTTPLIEHKRTKRTYSTRTIDFAVAGTKVIQIIVAAIGPNPSGTFGKVARNDG